MYRITTALINYTTTTNVGYESLLTDNINSLQYPSSHLIYSTRLDYDFIIYTNTPNIISTDHETKNTTKYTSVHKLYCQQRKYLYLSIYIFRKDSVNVSMSNLMC